MMTQKHPVLQVFLMIQVIQVVLVLQRFRRSRYSCVAVAQGIPGAQGVPHDLGVPGVTGCLLVRCCLFLHKLDQLTSSAEIT